MSEVSIVPSDLCHEEFVIVAAHSFEQLQHVVNSVFDRFEARLSQSNAKLKDLNERMRRAQTKIQQLTGTQRDLILHTPHRYPSKHVSVDVSKVIPSKLRSADENLRPYTVKSKFEGRSFNATESLTLFHVSIPELAETGAAQRRKTVDKHAFVGPLPERIAHLPSAFVFNSSEVAFSYPVACEGSSSGIGRRRVGHTEYNKYNASMVPTRKAQLAAAPQSLLRDNRRKTTPAGNMKYTPSAVIAPTIDIPLDLPNLCNILTLPDSGSNISPNKKGEEIPKDDEMKQGELRLEFEEPDAASGIVKFDGIVSSEASSKSARVVTETRLATFANDNLHKTILIPPPPPPPPPPVLATAFSEIAVQSQTTPDARSELMEAIRRVGGMRGARLRSMEPKSSDTVDKSKKAESRKAAGESCAGDLMSDLHSKLLMRRKGISGTQSTGARSGSLISHLSTVIPPPIHKLNQSDGDENEDEIGDDEDEWGD